MAIELDNSFTVPVPPEQAWHVLLDVERIAPCMPGASVTSVEGDEVAGQVKVKLGPLSLSYKGTAKFTVKEDRTWPRFVTWEPFPRRVGAWMRKKGEGLGGAPDQFDEPGATPGAAVRTSAESLPYSDSGPRRRPR